MNTGFDLCVVIPTYNEESHLPRLLAQLWRQRDIDLQIIIVDGGSRDGSAQISQGEFLQHPDRLTWCCTKAHRAKQLNLGAALANAEYLLFLHADTQLDDSVDLLRSALERLRSQNQYQDCAGHFPLLFNETHGQHVFGFYYYAAKTALNRIDVINGDQGFMLARKLFDELQGFDESLPYMEDARLANRILRHKRWITLPGRVHTSARRFLSEGFEKRQLLNSFLCNFNAIGMDAFFAQAADAYKRQSDSRQLDMLPFLRIIHRVTRAEGWIKALSYWYASGRYITQNAWQLAFTKDCQRDFKRRIAPHQVQPIYLDRFERYIAPWLLSPPFYVLCAALTYIWFYSLFIVYKQ